jgi:hypothetical protein
MQSRPNYKIDLAGARAAGRVQVAGGTLGLLPNSSRRSPRSLPQQGRLSDRWVRCILSWAVTSMSLASSITKEAPYG